MGYRKEIATNIWTESYYVKQITTLPDLKQWLETSGKKVYVLDELGKIAKKMRFMSDQNTQIMDVAQLIRHYDAILIGCAPSETFVDSQFLNTDILDAKIRKITQKQAKVYDYLSSTTYFLNNIPQTSIKYNSKDIATFSMKKKLDASKLTVGEQIAYYLHLGMRRKEIQKKLELHPEQYRREYNKFLAETLNSRFTANPEVGATVQKESPL